ncbi:DNA polymerase III subunit chi [Vibrio mangrovi]|uniref:DNA polymerase III subunit chi n=1 Tax=Vibrio mangrovi TaxID=474394 RepID=A0A1Y6IXH0_9VIBR|nr:DNA polymerase III subunit chi [Vibrio mangrovi]MDW6002895.1 DNA polymerase III subunit chi [Vibrio mangrovi]SMS02385.1 DNA polymerase III subunit chi [Vibrio mangrovi]
MKTATFYLIQPDSQQAQPDGFREYILFLTRFIARQGAKVYLNCCHREEAELFAELFWQAPAEDFLAHNLVGEGPRNGTPVEIGYPQVSPSRSRQIVINIAENNTTFADRFAEVIDFVPCEKNARQLARERYKIYRQNGYQLQTVEIAYP